MLGRTAEVPRAIPITFTSKTRRQAARSTSVTVSLPPMLIPATLISAPTGPYVASAASTARCQPDGSATSSTIPLAEPPAFSIASTTSPVSARSAHTTWAFDLASAEQTALPTDPAAPVTITGKLSSTVNELQCVDQLAGPP